MSNSCQLRQRVAEEMNGARQQLNPSDEPSVLLVGNQIGNIDLQPVCDFLNQMQRDTLLEVFERRLSNSKTLGECNPRLVSS